jgi:predicted nucleic acid-binding Zn finger protein
LHKKSNNSKVVSEEIVENKHEGKGRLLALSWNVYRLQNTDTFYVESEIRDNIYYFVRYNPSVFEWCSCPDNSTRGLKCKHQFAIEYAIRMGSLKDIDRLPAEAKRYPAIVSATKSYQDDDYDF